MLRQMIVTRKTKVESKWELDTDLSEWLQWPAVAIKQTSGRTGEEVALYKESVK